MWHQLVTSVGVLVSFRVILHHWEIKFHFSFMLHAKITQLNPTVFRYHLIGYPMFYSLLDISGKRWVILNIGFWLRLLSISFHHSPNPTHAFCKISKQKSIWEEFTGFLFPNWFAVSGWTFLLFSCKYCQQSLIFKI